MFADSLFWQQVLRFWSFQDPAVRTALAAMVLLGACCGSLGCFVVLRRLSLLGDSLGHAVLPGVCAGFLVTQTKAPRWIFLGAGLSALLASWLVGFIHRHSRLKTDAILGLVLSGFFGLGTVMLTRLQQFPYGSQSGLNQFLFGQASAIRGEDLQWIAVLAGTVLLVIVVAFKELAITSFDEGFSVSIGLPVRAIHYLLMGLLALAIVISIQAVGVVLLSALLITPAATAYLLTDRLKTMVVLAVVIGVGAGVLGLNLSFLGRSLPTGPFVVLVLGGVFLLAYGFSPRYGVVLRSVRRSRQAHRTRQENLLKSIYLLGESGEHPEEGKPVPLGDLARQSQGTLAAVRRAVRGLVRRDWVEIRGDDVWLKETGRQRARDLIRNYRLWELFLTHEIQLPADHTARDAENLEHILGPELVSQLEKRLGSGPS